LRSAINKWLGERNHKRQEGKVFRARFERAGPSISAESDDLLTVSKPSTVLLTNHDAVPEHATRTILAPSYTQSKSSENISMNHSKGTSIYDNSKLKKRSKVAHRRNSAAYTNASPAPWTKLFKSKRPHEKCIFRGVDMIVYIDDSTAMLRSEFFSLCNFLRTLYNSLARNGRNGKEVCTKHLRLFQKH
uniref:VWFA domain-containing protein n=1 Tax=Anisakis simplex TaxID=6269 RepID=A0A0M3JHM1_ANISI